MSRFCLDFLGSIYYNPLRNVASVSMVEITGGKLRYIPAETPRDVSPVPRRARKDYALMTAAAIVTSGTTVAYDYYQDAVHQTVSNFSSIQTERQPQAEAGFAHNGLIGIEPSTYLPGVIDMKYKNKETGAWEIYNVIGVDVVANGINTNAEMFGSRVNMDQQVDENGNTRFALEFERMHGFRVLDGNLAFGNGAHFSIVGIIPKDRAELTMWIEPHEDSSPIEKAAIANFYGAVENVNCLQIDGGPVEVASSYPQPNDGNLIGGDFYSTPVPSSRGTLSFWSEGKEFIQQQEYTEGEVVERELRRFQWRPEFGQEPRPNWYEMIRVWQRMKNNPIWKFSYRFKNDHIQQVAANQ